MPYASNDGVRIYYEVEGQGTPLIMQGGFAGALQKWRMDGWTGLLRDHHQLVLIDPRGHGRSDKPHDPEAYRWRLRATDVTAVLDALHLAQAHYLGYSMGGAIGWAIIQYAPERFRSLILGGFAPPEKLGLGEWGPVLAGAVSHGMDTFMSVLEQGFGPWWKPAHREMYAANDLEALYIVATVQDDWDLEALLPTITLPCLLFGGDQDPGFSGAGRAVRIMPDASLLLLPGLDHYGAAARSDLVVPPVLEFLAEVDRSEQGADSS
jgi:pimeloyl-ACP methyl ester carboxylesterase